MLTNYIHQVMLRAHFEIMENGRFYGFIPEFQGVWGEGTSLEECRDELIEAIEGWLIVKSLMKRILAQAGITPNQWEAV